MLIPKLLSYNDVPTDNIPFQRNLRGPNITLLPVTKM
jgi:hypothetical protein